MKTFAYATDNRITGITYTNTVNPTPNVTFTWDTYLPRLDKMTDGTGTTTYCYTTLYTNGASQALLDCGAVHQRHNRPHLRRAGPPLRAHHHRRQ